MNDLETLSTKELVAAYNRLSGKPPISAWKRKVAELKAIVLKLAPTEFFSGPAPSRPVFDEAVSAELAAQSGRPVDHEADAAPTKEKAPKAPKAKKAEAPKSDRGAIRRYTEELLLKTKGSDPETKKPLGLPYSSILAAVLEKFPEAQTSLNCLRWYATKMNKRTGAEAVRMPIRPKAEKQSEAA